MAQHFSEQDLQSIEAAVSAYPAGAGIRDIHNKVGGALPRRTLQYRLAYLVDVGRLIREGEKRGAKYLLSSTGPDKDAPVYITEYRLPSMDMDQTPTGVAEPAPEPSVSRQAAAIRDYVRQPLSARTPVGYQRDFLDAYRPNETAYLTGRERDRLRQIGVSSPVPQAAGTYAKQILSRLLIDLSWNSSRLEGNTYSMLDTQRLIDFGAEADGKEKIDAQMILNHKDAIEFLVDGAEVIDFNRYTMLNLHALLAGNLLPNPNAAGRLRHIIVGIGQSVFEPLAVPQLVEECFDQILATVAAINDPYEQALFVMAQLPYLQPFEDVNKRVSRLAANIPFIKANLMPLSFVDVSATDYTEAMLGVYEMNRVELLKEVFIRAYARSAARYKAARQSLGEPDPFRFKHRAALKEIVRAVALRRMDRKSAYLHIARWVQTRIEPYEREQFRQAAEDELLALHEGNFARYQIKPAQFSAWQAVWNTP